MGLLFKRLWVWLLTAGLALCAFCGGAQAQVTSLTMVSDRGDFVGNGQSYRYTPADGMFTAQMNYQGGVSITFLAQGESSHFWHLDFSSASRGPLTTGPYLEAVRFPFNDGVNGLDVSGDGRGCNALNSSFNVLQVTYGPNNTVEAFDATFEQHCEGAPQALRGEIRYNASVSLDLTAPASLQLHVGQSASLLVTATDVLKRRVYLTPVTLPPGATFVDLGNNQGRFRWTPNATQTGSFVATFWGDNRQGNLATTSTRITVVPLAPYNDDIANAAPITTVPATASQVVTTATGATDDPYCYGTAQSVWYAFTAPSTMRVEVNTFGSGYDTAIGVFTGNRGALTMLACNGDSNKGLQSRARFDAVAGTIYYVMVSSQYEPSSAANLVLNVQAAPPAYSFNARVNQVGTVAPGTRAVAISGTVQCTFPTFVTVSGSLRQGTTAPITGHWNAWVACNGATPWTAQVVSTETLLKRRTEQQFGAGKATVGAVARAFDPETGEYRSMNLTQGITLRGD